MEGNYAGTHAGSIRRVKVDTLLVIMITGPKGVSNAISFCNGMAQDVLAVIISCESNRTITNRRGNCSKRYSGFDLFLQFEFVRIYVGSEDIRNGICRTFLNQS